jgi:cardiolipin synthase
MHVTFLKCAADDSAKPILDAIDGATKSLRVKMFIFSDPSLLKEIIRVENSHARAILGNNSDARDNERKLN